MKAKGFRKPEAQEGTLVVLVALAVVVADDVLRRSISRSDYLEGRS